MNSHYRQLLQSIQSNYNNSQFLSNSITQSSSSLFVSPSNTHQQLFLQKLINIYVLRKKEYNKINQERIGELMKQSAGGFTDLLLGMRFMSYCMENKVQVSYERFGMLKLLTGWMELLERVSKEDKVNLCHSVLGMIVPQNRVVTRIQQLIVYLNYIAVDLQQLIQRSPSSSNANNHPQQQSQGNIHSPKQPSQPTMFPSHLDRDDLIQFLNHVLPKTLYNIVIQQSLLTNNRPLTSINPMEQQKQYDFLFSEQSIEYFAKQKSHYQQLIKLIFHTILKVNDLQQPLQRQLMLAAMRYLYMYNRNKHAESFSLFTKVYDKLSQAVRFALSDEFILFFKIVKKIGHIRFIDYLRKKYPFIQELHRKLDPAAIVGYPKDSLSSFHTFPIMESIFVNPGTMVQRFIEILEPCSLLYFYIGIKALDINVRFYYLGAFTNSVEKKHLLLNKEKMQVQFKGNIIALEKGIYMFQFDNTYSWVKGKNILYDTMVLTPLDLGRNDVEKDKFLNVLFNKFEMNSCSEVIDIKDLGKTNNMIQQVQNYAIKQAEQQKLTVNMHFDPDTNIYNLKTVGEGKIYEYETDNQTLFNKKAHEIYGALQESKGPSAFEWLIEGGLLLSGIAMIQQWCNDPVGFTAAQIQQQTKEEKPLSEQQNEAHIQQMSQSESPQQQNYYPSLISQPAESMIKEIESSPHPVSSQDEHYNPKQTQPELEYIQSSESEHNHQQQQKENDEQVQDYEKDDEEDKND